MVGGPSRAVANNSHWFLAQEPLEQTPLLLLCFLSKIRLQLLFQAPTSTFSKRRLILAQEPLEQTPLQVTNP
jgi:hypothetical protein